VGDNTINAGYGLTTKLICPVAKCSMKVRILLSQLQRVSN
jgi:hypothetical protein